MRDGVRRAARPSRYAMFDVCYARHRSRDTVYKHHVPSWTCGLGRHGPFAPNRNARPPLRLGETRLGSSALSLHRRPMACPGTRTGPIDQRRAQSAAGQLGRLLANGMTNPSACVATAHSSCVGPLESIYCRCTCCQASSTPHSPTATNYPICLDLNISSAPP